MPDGFPLNAVQGKTYDTAAPEMQPILAGIANFHVPPPGTPSAAEHLELEGPMYGQPIPIRQRLGQGTFRVMITEAFDRRCAVTGERTLPVLEAAHILPVAEGGRHATDNGLLLRSDVHRLFDAGYVTVTPQHRFLVSGRIKKEFDNGEEYYALNDTQIRLPRDPAALPRKDFLQWHADACFLG